MDISTIRQHPLLQGLATSANQRRAVVAANVLGILLLAYSLAEISWLLLPQKTSETQMIAVVQESQATTSSGKRDWAAEISRYHPFGKSETKAPSKAKPTTNAPDTRLNLTLKGVIVTGITTNDRALISGSGASEMAYAIGNELPGKSTLREIYADRVILERNNRMETLRLNKQKSSSTPKNASTSRANSSASKASQNPRARMSLREYRDEFMSQPQELANHVRATPVYKDGNMQGIRLRAIKDRSLLRRHGLRKSDIITAVNGIKIDSEIKGLEILENLRNAEQVDLEISRNGKQRNLALTLDK